MVCDVGLRIVDVVVRLRHVVMLGDFVKAFFVVLLCTLRPLLGCAALCALFLLALSIILWGMIELDAKRVILE